MDKRETDINMSSLTLWHFTYFWYLHQAATDRCVAAVPDQNKLTLCSCKKV